MTPDTDRDPAQGRYFAIQAVRVAGVVQVFLGIAVIYGKLQWPAVVGYVLFLNGLFDALFLPTLLARRWKTPK